MQNSGNVIVLNKLLCNVEYDTYSFIRLGIQGWYEYLGLSENILMHTKHLWVVKNLSLFDVFPKLNTNPVILGSLKLKTWLYT